MSVKSDLAARSAAQIKLCPTTVYRQDLQRSIDKESKDALKAALYLLNDDIHNAHMLAQSGEGDPDFDFIHSIVHRREGDFWNSRCWTDQVDHPVLRDTWDSVTRDLKQARTKAKDYNLRVEAWTVAGGKDEDEERELQELQHRELMALLRYLDK